jgi:uncharacterized protein (TIGR02996 family)
MTEEEIPFIRAILHSPRDYLLRLVYADWLEERGDPRAEYLRLWIAFNQAANAGEPAKAYSARLQKIGIRGHWLAFVDCWEPRKEVDEDEIVFPIRTSDANLRYGPCFICGRSKNMKHWVSRMPCEKCNRVFCWECADTGVYGSLADFRHFLSVPFGRIGFRLGSDSCPFCQDMSWMKKHGG